jgi:SAM-dependent methyltransferase
MTFSVHNKAIFDKHADEYRSAEYSRTDEIVLVDRYFTERPARVLVGGAGGGRTLPMFLERGFEVTAVDIAPAMVAAIRERFGSRVQALQQDIQRTDFDNAEFDYVFLPFHTVCYVDDIDVTIRELSRITKPEGIVIANALNHFFLKSIADGSFLQGKDRLIRMHRDRDADSVLTHCLSICDAGRFRRFFQSVRVYGRTGLQEGPPANWKAALQKAFPAVDKSLYFVCARPRDTLSPTV